ncbi:hypothetical protein C7212DRAFT_321870 [Tuber magnatum]|uniref:Uncharacterized protein n=1 Tax=Tuber magnatum TaxID=42249 RepID=A0A317SSY5_9PEZI|nr:hypothetical protein C7212DRAFT_321870 [Tuber magnatum]
MAASTSPSSLLARVLMLFLLLAMLASTVNALSASGTGLAVSPTTNSTAEPTYTTPAVPTGTSDQPSSANTLSSTAALFGALIAVSCHPTPTGMLKLVRWHGN